MQSPLHTLETKFAQAGETWQTLIQQHHEALNRLEGDLDQSLQTQAATEDQAALIQHLRERTEQGEKLVAALRSQLAEARSVDVSALQAEIESLRAGLAEANRDLLEAREALNRQSAPAAPTVDPSPAPPPNILGDVSAFGPKGHKKRIGEILVDAGLLSEVQVEEVLAAQEADPHHRFGALVVERGFTTEHYVAAILAAQLRLPFADLEKESPQPEAVSLSSAHLARHHRCIPLHREEGILHVAMENPLDLIAIEDIELASGLRVSPVVAVASQIEAAIARYYS